MEQALHIKYVVKVISVTKPLQKTHFTIRHPENASCLSGIAVTTTCLSTFVAGPEGRPRTLPNNAGFLSLAIPNKGDVFYTEDLKAEKGDYRDKVERLINPIFLESGFEFSAKRFDYLDTAMPIKDALMEGYYEDFFIQPILIRGIGGPKGGGGGFPGAGSTAYKVTLYLRYVVNEKEIIETPKPCN